MKYLFSCLMIGWASTSWGAIHIATKIEVAGVTVSPSLVVNEGQWVTFTQDDVTLKLKVRPKDGAAQINLELSRGKAGKQEQLGKPIVVAKWNEPAQVAANEEDGSLLYRVTVTPSMQ